LSGLTCQDLRTRSTKSGLIDMVIHSLERNYLHLGSHNEQETQSFGLGKKLVQF